MVVLVVDTSALVAILLREPDPESLARCLIDAPRRFLSAVTHAELSFVIEGPNREDGRLDPERLLNMVRLKVVR